MKPELKNYRITTIEGEETYYNTLLRTEGTLFVFETYRLGKLTKIISIPFNSVMKVETLAFADNTEGEDGAIVIPHSQFREFSQHIEAFDKWIKDDKDFDPAS